MIDSIAIVIVLAASYFVGSIPTALIVSKKIKGIDIRSVGDGNMGARNTFHEIGRKYGITVAIIDFCKGILPVLLAYVLSLNLGWQILAAVLTILGHDFPLFADFRGGQGLATSLGTMQVLLPLPTIIGLTIYGVAFLVIKKSSISCAIGGAIIALILVVSQQWLLLVYVIIVFLFIPTKQFIDSLHRKIIGIAK
ncbi:MAG: glycerol-3-phosphate acyltransferase [Dehalococcoidales bacterium]